MMNKKGETDSENEDDGGLLNEHVVFFLVLLIFLIGVFAFLKQYSNGAAILEEYGVKEFAKAINLAEPGDRICLDVHDLTAIGFENKVSASEFFQFDNINNEICVKLNKGKKTCYSYFNDVDISVNKDSLVLGVEKNVKGEIVNVFCFDVVQSVRRENAAT